MEQIVIYLLMVQKFISLKQKILNMSEEKKKRLKEYQKNHREAKKYKYNDK